MSNDHVWIIEWRPKKRRGPWRPGRTFSTREKARTEARLYWMGNQTRIRKFVRTS